MFRYEICNTSSEYIIFKNNGEKRNIFLSSFSFSFRVKHHPLHVWKIMRVLDSHVRALVSLIKIEEMINEFSYKKRRKTAPCGPVYINSYG